MKLISFGSGSSGNSHLITIDNTRILIDAGINPKKMGIRLAELGKVDGVLITHEHQDHAKYVQKLRNLALDIYLTEGTLDALNIKDDYRYHIIKEKQAFFIANNVKILPFASFHDASEPVNFLITGKNAKLVYITDTGIAPYKINGMTHIMVEANHSDDLLDVSFEKGYINSSLYKRIKKNHLSIDQTLAFLEMNDLTYVKHINLTHLSNANSNEETFKKSVQERTGREVSVL